MSKIEWTDISSNPIHLHKDSKTISSSNGGHWCRKVSEGCANCYAESQNQNNLDSQGWWFADFGNIQ